MATSDDILRNQPQMIWRRRSHTLWLVFGVALLAASVTVLILARSALAAPWCNPGIHGVCNYAQGQGGVGFLGQTTDGFLARSLNRVYHNAGKTWLIYYRHSDGSVACQVQNSSNPTSCPYADSAARSVCFNVNDSGGVTWTCQTTKP